MNKIWLISKREYLTRVKSKTFILITLLAPLGILLFSVVAGLIFSSGSDEKRNIAVFDPHRILNEQLQPNDNIEFNFTNRDLEELKGKYIEGVYDGILEIPDLPDPTTKDVKVLFHSDNQLAIDENMLITNRIEKQVREYKIQALALDKAKIESLNTQVTLQPRTITDTDKQISSMTGIVGSILGGIISYIMFFIILLYGAQVMRSVMEEKINRVVEVLISSVKPFELMMGKIIGVGSVGLTQVAIWIILIPIIFAITKLFFDIDPSAMSQMNPGTVGDVNAVMNEKQDEIALIFQELGAINWWTIVPLILFYFFGGYFAYAALFAAVGSAVGEDVNEAQGLTFPIMIPLILAIYISMSAVDSPNNSLSVWSSMIPLLSSIVMPTRLPAGPPIWQIVVSVLLLVIFVICFVWLAGRIYRVGILMYGKKASFRELGKWIFYKS